MARPRPAPVLSPAQAVQEQNDKMLAIAGKALHMRAMNEKYKTPDDAYNPKLIFSSKPGQPETLGSSVANAIADFRSVKPGSVKDVTILTTIDKNATLLNAVMVGSLEKLGRGHPIKVHEWTAQFEGVKTQLHNMANALDDPKDQDKNFLLAKVDQIEKMQNEVLGKELERMNIQLANQKLNNQSKLRIAEEQIITYWRDVKDKGEERSNAVLSAVNPGSLKANTYQVITYNKVTKEESKSDFYLHVDEEGNVQTSPSTYANFEEQIRAQARILRENNGAVIINWKNGEKVDWAMVKTMIRIAAKEGLGVILSKNVEEAKMELQIENASVVTRVPLIKAIADYAGVGTSQQEIDNMVDKANKARAKIDREFEDKGQDIILAETSGAKNSEEKIKTTEALITKVKDEIEEKTPLAKKLETLDEAQKLIVAQKMDFAVEKVSSKDNSLGGQLEAIRELNDRVTASIDVLNASDPASCAAIKKIQDETVIPLVEEITVRVSEAAEDKRQLEQHKQALFADGVELPDLKLNELLERIFPDASASPAALRLSAAFEQPGKTLEAYEAAVTLVEERVKDRDQDVAHCREALRGLKSSVLQAGGLTDGQKKDFMNKLEEVTEQLGAKPAPKSRR